jgi:hypothetical protein
MRGATGARRRRCAGLRAPGGHGGSVEIDGTMRGKEPVQEHE